MSSKKLLVPNTDNMAKEGINNMETKPNVVEKVINNRRKKIKLTPCIKQTNHKHLKVKKINLSAINQTRVYNWINQGIIKELK